MRRLISILLLVLLGLPLAAPLLALTVDDEAGVPACCRRLGAHHCMMSMGERSQLKARTIEFRSPTHPCPFSAQQMAPSHVDQSPNPTEDGLFRIPVTQSDAIAQTEVRRRIARDRSRQKRGPPSA